MEEQLLMNILEEMRRQNDMLWDIKQSLRKVEEQTNFISNDGIDAISSIKDCSKDISEITEAIYRSKSNSTVILS